MNRIVIVRSYPMNLPPYDPVRLELEDKEDLGGTQASLEVFDPQQTSMWFSGKEMRPDGGKKLGDYLGRNEKTKVICKLQKVSTPFRLRLLRKLLNFSVFSLFRKDKERLLVNL